MVPGTFSGTIPSVLASRNFSDLYSARITWGGWGSNPRPADYEKPGPVLRVRYLHGCLGPRTGPRPPQRAPDVNYGAPPHTARYPPDWWFSGRSAGDH